jgi:hypothetical protein
LTQVRVSVLTKGDMLGLLVRLAPTIVVLQFAQSLESNDR